MNRKLTVSLFAAALALGSSFVGRTVYADEVTVADVLKAYDGAMSPKTFDGLMTMIAHREDGTTRGYKMRIMKSEDDKLRVWFFEPAAAKGQEMLRVGDNMWVYMPNLKRSLRIASRESFQGGDFNNGDVLRVNYESDYQGKLVDSGDPSLIEADLSAKTKDASYDRIKLWVTKKGLLPSRAEYYAASGKMLRLATFTEVKNLRGLERPTHIVMRNELATKKRFSELNTLDMKMNIEIVPQKFVLDDLGR